MRRPVWPEQSWGRGRGRGGEQGRGGQVAQVGAWGTWAFTPGRWGPGELWAVAGPDSGPRVSPGCCGGTPRGMSMEAVRRPAQLTGSVATIGHPAVLWAWQCPLCSQRSSS